ncbi:hypothetical protein LC040_06810 [Bacillus tianshenii]|nr:hypothetical protein LC040_06810 [Bacillus tianshenii]
MPIIQVVFGIYVFVMIGVSLKWAYHMYANYEMMISQPKGWKKFFFYLFWLLVLLSVLMVSIVMAIELNVWLKELKMTIYEIENPVFFKQKDSELFLYLTAGMCSLGIWILINFIIYVYKKERKRLLVHLLNYLLLFFLLPNILLFGVYEYADEEGLTINGIFTPEKTYKWEDLQEMDVYIYGYLDDEQDPDEFWGEKHVARATVNMELTFENKVLTFTTQELNSTKSLYLSEMSLLKETALASNEKIAYDIAANETAIKIWNQIYKPIRENLEVLAETER